MTETTRPKKARKKAKRKGPAQKLREATAELKTLRAALSGEKDRCEMFIQERDMMQQALRRKIDNLEANYSEALRQARSHLAESERFEQFYRDADDARRHTRQALELALATLIPDMPSKTLLEALESAGNELFADRMEVIRPILIDGLAEGARLGIPLFAKIDQRKKEQAEANAEEELGKVGQLPDFDDLLGAMMGTARPFVDTSEGDGQSSCKDPENCPVHKPGGFWDQLFSR